MAISDVVFTTAQYGALLVIPYLLSLFSYRVFFHPLKSYPGPLAARLTNLYAGFYALLMRLHLVTASNLDKYGPVLRLGPDKLVFNSPRALQDIYNNDKVTKSHVYRMTGTGGKPSIFSAIDKRLHSVKRKLIGKAVTEKAMHEFEPTMMGQVDIFLQQLLTSVKEGSHINMTDRCERLGMDIVCLLAFGYPLKMQTDPAYRFFIRGVHVGSYQNNCFMQWPLLKSCRLHYLIMLAGLPQRIKYIRMLQLMIKSRLSQDKHAQKDLYSFVVDQLDDPNEGITTSELWSEALFFMPAGGDTTSTALSALFFYLSRHPSIYAKLSNEIRNTFTDGSDIHGGPKLSSCRYLRACIDETLRISPPVSGTLWREPYAEAQTEPFIVDGHVIPPGTQVGVSIYALHHNEKYFPNPYEFRPERWLDQDPATLSAMNSAFCAFSIGARGCAGKAMAYLEASLVIAKTLWYFDFEPATGSVGELGGGALGNANGRARPNEYQIYDIFAAVHNGPNLVFKPRGELYKELTP